MAARAPLGQDCLQLKLIIRGKVQGVFFRVTVKGWAQALGLAGYAANLADGSVEVVAQGSRSALEELRERCQEGSEAARVEQIKEEWCEDLEVRFGDFEVR